MLLPRLRDLRQDSDLTQEQVAHTLFICRNAYGKYKRGEAHIPLESLVALARYYRVSTDYLLGLTDVPAPYPPKAKKERPCARLYKPAGACYIGHTILYWYAK